MVATTDLSVRTLGHWAWEPLADRWRWDDEMFGILGYRPGEVEPTTDLLLSHQAPACRPSVSSLIESLRVDPREFSVGARVHARDAAASTPVCVAGCPGSPGSPTLHGWVAVLPHDLDDSGGWGVAEVGRMLSRRASGEPVIPQARRGTELPRSLP